jgi:hypothetical protein
MQEASTVALKKGYLEKSGLSMATRYESVKHPLCSMTIPVASASLFFLQDKKDANSRLMSKQHVFIFQPDNSLVGFVASLVFQQW